MIQDAKFQEAEIEVDAILSYDLLLKNKVGVFPHHKALALDTSKLRLLYGIERRNQKFPLKVPILVSKLDSPNNPRKWRLKENVIGEVDEDIVKQELGALSLPLQELDQKSMWLNARERNIMRRNFHEVKGVARQRALIVAIEPPETQGRAKKNTSSDTRHGADREGPAGPSSEGPYRYAFK